MAESLPVEAIAHVCHEANRALQLEQNDPTIPVSVPWVDTDEEQRQSLIDGVMNALAGATPEQSHENWLRFKLERGWTWGPVKDEGKREHPLLVHYQALPAAQRLKDGLFTAIARTLGGFDGA